MRRGVARGILFAALSSMVLLVCERALLRGEALLGRDMLSYAYPRVDLLGEAYRAGSLPRWNPYAYHGVSTFGPRLGGVVYPPNLLFVFGAPLGWSLFVALHLLLALLGARRWALEGEADSGAALATGLAYGLGAFVVCCYYWTYLVSAALLPWAAWAGRLLARDPRRGAAWGGAVIGLCLLAVEPQGALYLGGALALEALHFSPRAARGRSARWVAGVAALSLLAGGLATLALLDEVPRTNRSLADWAAGGDTFGLSVGYLVDLLLRGSCAESSFTGYWAWSLHQGEVPWCRVGLGGAGSALALLGLTRAGRARRSALLLVGLGLALAATGFGARFGLRYPAKWLALSALGLAGLVGAGVSALRAGGARPLLQLSLGLALLAALPTLGLLAPGAGEWLAAGDPRVDPLVAREATFAACARTLCGALAVALVALGARRGRLDPRLASALLLGALAGELCFAARRELPSSPAPLFARPGLADLIQERSGSPSGVPPRLESTSAVRAGLSPGAPPPGTSVFEQAALAEQRALAPNAGARCGIRSVDAFGSVSPLALELLTRDERFARLSPARQAALLDAELFLLPLPDYQALKSTPARGELWVHGQQQRPPKHLLVGNRRCPPWGYLIGAARRVESTSAALEALLAPDHDPRRQVVIGPEGRDLQAPAGTLPARPVAPSRFEPERIELELELREPAWLVLRETFSPHWEARVDGALVPCARADLLYRALPLEAGRHRVVLRYAPSWWWPGLAASALGWALLAALALSSLRKASRPGA